MKFAKREYEDNSSLDVLAHKIADSVPELSEAAASKFKAFYSTIESEHIGGKARRLDGAVKFQTGLDFFILIHKQPFMESDELHKIRILCHELYHIERERTYYVIRHHAGDFCEISEHDVFSYRLALKAMERLGLKYTNTEQARKYAKIS